MRKFSYVLAVGNIMYEMVCTRPNIAHGVGVVIMHMKKIGKVY